MCYLKQRIRETVDLNNGRVSFYDYMNFCLYNPKTGFYNNSMKKFFKEGGDFFTLPEYGRLFAYCFTLKLRCFLYRYLEKCLLEVGAGTGRFVHDVVTFLYQQGVVVKRIVILEYSDFLRKKQCVLLKSLKYNCKITWVKKIPYGFTGVVICNEILDAIPLHGVCLKQNRVFERFVTYKGKQFNWLMFEKKQDVFVEYVKKFIIVKNVIGEVITFFTEAFLYYNSFLCYFTRNLALNFLYFFDYGYEEVVYYDKKRYRGTLRCYYKKKTYNSPFLFIGLQDITAHVDFTSFMHLCKLNNIRCLCFLCFYEFFTLEKFNFFVQSVDAPVEYLKKLNDELDLVFSTEKMGNIFKVVILQKK